MRLAHIVCAGVAIACAPPGPSESFEPAGTASMWRLTESQYRNSVSDLFTSDDVQWIEFSDEVTLRGFEQHEVRVVTPVLIEQYQQMAAAIAVRFWPPTLACGQDGGDNPLDCGRRGLVRLAEQAWRGPLSFAEQLQIESVFGAEYAFGGFDAGVQLTVQLILQSPRFLYLIEHGVPEGTNDGTVPLTDWEMASRLSFFLWDRPPDDALREEAAQGRLSTRQQIETNALRMLADERALGGVLELHRQWLDFDATSSIVADIDTYFGEFESPVEQIAAFHMTELAMRTELDLYTSSWYLDGSPSLAGFLTRTESWASRELMTLYGASPLGGEKVTVRGASGLVYVETTLQPVSLPEAQRAGFLTLAGALASRANPVQPSPVERGVFVLDRLLCDPVGPPPEDVPGLDTESTSDVVTNRDQFEAHTIDPSCASCHTRIDGIGFLFEHYDSLGAWRDLDNGVPVDASGGLEGTDVDGPITDAVELAHVLAGSRDVYDCAANQWWRYAHGRSEHEDDEVHLGPIRDAFWAGGGYVDDLILDIVTSDAFRSLTVEDL